MKKKNKEDVKVFSLRFFHNPNLREEIKALAKRENISMNKYILNLLKNHVEQKKMTEPIDKFKKQEKVVSISLLFTLCILMIFILPVAGIILGLALIEPETFINYNWENNIAVILTVEILKIFIIPYFISMLLYMYLNRTKLIIKKIEQSDISLKELEINEHVKPIKTSKGTLYRVKRKGEIKIPENLKEYRFFEYYVFAI
jgi:hypothetical protein